MPVSRVCQPRSFPIMVEWAQRTAGSPGRRLPYSTETSPPVTCSADRCASRVEHWRHGRDYSKWDYATTPHVQAEGTMIWSTPYLEPLTGTHTSLGGVQPAATENAHTPQSAFGQVSPD